LYLRKAKLFGFKSFADRTELELDPRLIAIVGPNGCGKSNIVDAILWALGEHNPRTIRAATVADLIFSGSARRKGLGYAEVQLHFDNEDMALPYPAPEVVVTRRVGLDGEGEYAINGKPCRQKDIVGLFADTGVGRTGYSIVGQRDVDAVLSAQPEHRRLLVDEAAGVQRFRARKEETVKRLDAASRHLERAGDLLNEIERQLSPLEEQAAEAETYRTARDRLHELELGLVLRDLHRQNERLSESDEEITTVTDRIDSIAQELAEEERQAKQLAERVADAEKEVDHRRDLQQSAFTRLERAESAMALAQERLKSLQRLVEAEEAAGKSSQAERQRLADELASAQRRIESIQAGLAALPAEESGGDLDAVRAELEKSREALTAARRDQLEHRRREIERREAVLQVCRLRDEAAELRREQDQAAAEFDTLLIRGAEAETLVTDRDAALRQVAADLEEWRRKRPALAEESASVERELAFVEATSEALTAGAAGDAAAALLERAGDLEIGLARLAGRLGVAAEHRAAIDAALGPLGGILVTETARDSERVVRLLSREGIGRAAVIGRGGLEADDTSDLQRRAEEVGDLRIAADLVDAPQEDRAVVDALLGRVLVAETWREARKAARRLTGWRKIVTLAGEAIDPSGAFEAGEARGRVGLEAELSELAGRSDELRSQAQSCRARLEECDRRISEGEERERTCRESLDAARETAAARMREIDSARQRLDLVQGQINRLEDWINELGGGLGVPDDDHPLAPDPEKLEPEVARLERELAALEAAGAHSAQERDDLRSRLEEETERAGRLKSQIAEADQRDEGRSQRLMDLSRQLEKCEADQAGAEIERERAAEERRDADAQFEDARLGRAALLEDSFAAAERVKALRSEREKLANRAHALDLERAKADIRRAQHLQTLAEEHEIAAERAIEMASRVELPKNAASEAAALRRELRTLGEVNLGAAQAVRDLRRRRDEMIAQRDDLVEARREILATMQEIEDATRERFNKTFGGLQEAFAQLFARLFEGGEAALKLTTPEEIMTSGIDIEVQLPGKRRQRMELLSGGERSLTALAFLFALLRVKPSPFCILDEVDAALDGRNVERFCSMLDEFAGEIQFVIVTHNAGTIEAAEVWYGVTMQEPGVSTVIPFGKGARAVVEASV
jgi:chromosome segregation protein